MLIILTRGIDQAIVIGEDIRVMILDIDRGKIRLGIEAPRGVPIFREELLPLDEHEHTPAAGGEG